MVKLSVDMITRGTSGYTKKKRDEDIDQYLKRLTHLYLEDKSIDDIGEDLAMCRSLSVLYLYDNKVDKIPDLTQNFCLTHLYLQNNMITVMTNLNQLRKLTKLYLGGNKITVVEGIDKLDQLEELHIENQSLPIGEKLLFDPRSLIGISRSLRVLNVSGNNLDSLKELAVVSDLQQLMASGNRLRDLNEIASLLKQWRRMWRLDLNDNPFCLKSKYRDRIIIMSDSLGMLDGKEITSTARQFLKNWKASRDAQKKKQDEILHVGDGDNSHSTNESSDTRSHLNKISSYVMPGLPRKQFEEVLAKSSANMPSSASHHTNGAKYSIDRQFISSPNSVGQLHKQVKNSIQLHQQVNRSKSHTQAHPA